jgi:hypothetical protein
MDVVLVVFQNRLQRHNWFGSCSDKVRSARVAVKRCDVATLNLREPSVSGLRQENPRNSRD